MENSYPNVNFLGRNDHPIKKGPLFRSLTSKAPYWYDLTVDSAKNESNVCDGHVGGFYYTTPLCSLSSDEIDGPREPFIYPDFPSRYSLFPSSLSNQLGNSRGDEILAHCLILNLKK